jgi:hypothetical protein
MTPSSVASLLVAALALLGRPCPRNTAVARLLLQRASSDAALSPVERETCRDLAEALDTDADEPVSPPHCAVPASPITDWGSACRQHLLRQPPEWEGRRVTA